MNLYEWEGKNLFAKHGIAVPKAVLVRRGDNVITAYEAMGVTDVVVKAQVLSGKRGKNNGVRFCSTAEALAKAVSEMFAMDIRGQYVAAVRIEEKLPIVEEHYLSITYDTNRKQPVLIYSKQGGMDIEEVPEEKIEKILLDVRQQKIPLLGKEGPLRPQSEAGVVDAVEDKAPHWTSHGSTTPPAFGLGTPPSKGGDSVGGGNNKLSPPLEGGEADPPRRGGRGGLDGVIDKLWNCFLQEDCRLVEINPLVKTTDGRWIAADAKVAIDDDAFFRHGSTSSPQATNWAELEPRTMLGRLPTEREMAVKKIDEGEKYYQGTAGKYIEMDGDVAALFSGGGASIAAMDALTKVGLRPANYTEYSGNPPREKVYALAKVVLAKPGLKGLWIVGGVANFTNIAETFHGIVDVLDEVKPMYPIVVRKGGPYEEEGMRLMRECAERNHLNMKLFGKEMSMSETAKILADMVHLH